MRIIIGLLGLALMAWGLWTFAMVGMSEFLSGWGVILLVAGLMVLASLSLMASGLSLFLFVLTLFVVGVVRLFMGLGDAWHWLLLALGVAILNIIGMAANAEDSSPDSEDSDSEMPEDGTQPGRETVGLSKPEALPTSQPTASYAASGSGHLHIPSAKEVIRQAARGVSGRRTTSKSCPTCNREMSGRAKFCGNCGSAI